MYLKEDISDLLRTEHHNKLMVIIMGGKLPIKTVGDRLLLMRAWINAGRPESKLEAMKDNLGEYWKAYMNPLTERLQSLDLESMLRPDLQLLGMTLTKDHSPIIRELLDQKLVEYLEMKGITSLCFQTSQPAKTKSNRLLTYQFKAKYSPLSLIKITFEWIGNKYNIRINLLSEPQTPKPLTDESYKNLKAVMYEVSEDWDSSLFTGCLEHVKFDDIILDCLIDNIRNHSSKLKA
jgi:hypothetical protein